MQSRPLQITAYAADQQGCGYHRILVPSNLLSSEGSAHVSVEPVMHGVDWHAAAKPDVIVFQRQFEPKQIENMRAIRQALPNTFLVYEIDDLLSEVPERNYHSSFISKSIAPQMKEAISLCDRVVVTTNGLAQWAREEMDAKDVVVVPNYIPQSYIRERAEPVDKKTVRVGWAGGVSHSGDLDLIIDAIENVEGVQWVFFGMKPECKLPENVEFHEFVPINQYMEKLKSLNLDLFLAPLEGNRFNECKSDLKLIEAAAVGAAVIASPTEPYMEFKPPVFSYALRAKDWTISVSAFAKLSYSQRKHHAKQMQTWAKSKRTYEANLAKRNSAWIPPGAELWVPSQEDVRARPLYIATDDERYLPHTVYPDLELACKDAIAANADVLWLRDGTSITPDGIARLRVSLLEDRLTASVAPLASDGCNAFPRLNKLTPVNEAQTKVLNEIVKEGLAGERGYMAAFSGPCLLIRNQGLRTLGAPDVKAYFGDAELALVEWTAKATQTGMRNIQVFEVFAGTTKPQQELNEAKIKRLEARDIIRFVRSTATPLSDELRQTVELRYLSKQWRGVEQNTGGLPNDYSTWAALKTDPVPISDGSKVEASCIYDSVHSPSSKYMMRYDGDTIVQPFAAALIQDALDAGADFVFGDHEEIDEEGNIQPFFKSGLDRTLLRSVDYVTQICGSKTDGRGGSKNHLYGLSSFSDKTKIVHIPHVLARVKRKTKDAGSAESQRIKHDNDAHIPNSVNDINPHLAESGFVFYRPKSTQAKSVAVIIHVGENPSNIAPCLATLIKNTETPIRRIAIAREFHETPIDLGEYADDPRIHFINMGSKSASKLLNFAASECEEDVLIFMSDEMRTIVPHWADSMLAYLEQDDVGAVGARIVHQSGVVAHAGVVISNGIAATVHNGLPGNSTGYFGAAVLSHEASAVSRQVMAIRRETFEKYRFDKEFHVDFMDYDLGARMTNDGLKQIVDCSAQFLSCAVDFKPNYGDFNAFNIKYKDFVDPYLNPNLLVNDMRFDYSALAITHKQIVEGQERVLLINDAASLQNLSLPLVQESKANNIVFRAVIDGFNLIMVAPSTDNSASWDMRDPGKLRAALNELRINRICMPSLIGAGAAPAIVECIKALMLTGIQFDYVGSVKAMICPRLDMTVNGEDCGEGYKKGADHCQGCINKNGSPFGLVDIRAWLSTWDDYATAKTFDSKVAA